MKKYRWPFIVGGIVLILILGGSVALLRGAGSDSAADPTLSVALGETGPRIVRQNPIAGQRLPLSPVIELTFDRGMDSDATGAAWKFASVSSSGSAEAGIPGRISWEDSRTMCFEPALPLEPSTEYVGVFDITAAGLDGSSPDASIRLEFQTVDALAVGQVFPADGTRDVEAESTITVIFNRPIVELKDVEDSVDHAVPIRISPLLAGSGEWVSTSVYVFTPDSYLNSGTEYAVTVAAGLEDFTGEALAEEYTWRFTTRAPGIANFALKDGAQNPSSVISDVLLDQAFIVTFLQPMDAESVAGALSLIEDSSGKAFPFRETWNDSRTVLTIEPVGLFRPGVRYNLTLADTAEAEGGGTLSEGLDVVLHTVPLPMITGVTPQPASAAKRYDSSFSIRFSAPMDFNSLKGRVKVSPAPAEEPRLSYDPGNWTLYGYGLEPGTQYEVRILPGMRDIYGHVISEGYVYSFTTGDLWPYARMLYPHSLLFYRAEGPQHFFFEYTNLKSAAVSLFPLSLPEYFALSNRPDGSDEAFPKSDPINTWTIDLQAEKNALARLKILLEDGSGGRLEPGFYFIALQAEPFDEDSRYHQTAVFVVATDNITFKSSGNDALAWVTDLETGEPSAGVELVLYGRKFNELGRAVTDSDGIASWPEAVNPFYVSAQSGGHVAFASQDFGSGISQDNAGVWQLYYRDPQASFVYLYTDRPLYRPGQTVEFTGVARSEDDLHYAPPTMDEVVVTIRYQGETIHSETVPLSESGSFAGSYDLGEDAPLGSYTISIQDKPDGEAVCSVAFRVADYRKPEFQVDVTADTNDVSPGGEVVFGVQADYYSGGKVGNAAVEWFLEYTPYFFVPPADYRAFSFTDWDRETGAKANSGGSGTVAEGEGTTGADGHLDITLPMSPGKTKGDWLVSFRTNVTDVTGNLVGGGTQVVMHQSLVYAGIRPASYVCRAGEEQAFDLVVLDWNGEPVPDQAVSVQIVKRNWYSVQQLDEEGKLHWVTTVKETPAASFARVVTDSDGLARVAFTPGSGGVYKALVTVRDSNGDTHQASAYVWAAGSSYVPWRMTDDRSFTLIADKDSYEPGETAEILIAQPFEGEVYALVTYERGHVYRGEVVKLSGNSTIYRLPITADMAPGAYLSVVVIAGARGHGTPDFRMGMLRLEVATTQQELDVKITTDKPSAGPGDSVTYTVEARDSKGNPVRAEISWALVDKALLALAPSNVAPILDAFYPSRSLSVRTSLGIVWNAEDFLASYKETQPTGEGSGSGGGDSKGAGDMGVVDVREDFQDTAFFRAQTTTGPDGKAQVTVALPENLTTWRMTVRAVTAESRVGEAQHELVSTKPLFITLQTPRFFVAGDTARLGAGVHNNGKTGLKIAVWLDAEGLTLYSPARQEITVPGGQTAYVYWDASVAPGARRVDLTAHAESGTYTDASKPAVGTLSGRGIPVYTYTVPETVGTSGMLSDSNSITEAFAPPPSGEDAELVVEISPSLTASWTGALRYLEQYPYLCLEQTVSRFLPNLMAVRVLKDRPSASPSLQHDLDREVGAALQRIYSTQNYDGGWSWWGSHQSDPQTSAYVLLGLIEAGKSGYNVRESVLENGLDYLRGHLSEVKRNDPSWKFNREAFLLYVFRRGGGAGSDSGLYQNRSSLGVYGKAFLALAMQRRDPDDGRIDTLLSDLNNAAVLSAAGIHWEEKAAAYWDWNSDVRTTAIVLNAMIRLDPENPLNASAVRWLMANRTQDRWGSTQETAWAVMALAGWVEASHELETDYSYAIGWNGKVWTDGRFDPSDISDPLRLTRSISASSGDASRFLVLARGAGAGNLYYTAYMTVTLPVDEVEALDRGILVRREYYTLEDPKHPITEIGRGELVRVRLTVVASSTLHHVVVDDPLPAGLEAIDASLSGNAAVPSVYTVKKFNETGWGWWFFDHQEVRDEKVVLSAEHLPPGTYVYTYLARAGIAGTFNVIPATAAEFYFPDVSGRSAGSVFTVTP